MVKDKDESKDVGLSADEKLPDGWIVTRSQSHPDRVYFFNVNTKQSSWENPCEAIVNKRNLRSSKGKTTNLNNNNIVDSSDDGGDKVNARKLLVANRKNAPSFKASKDTAQMKMLREKVAQRRSIGNADKQKISADPRLRKRVVNGHHLQVTPAPAKSNGFAAPLSKKIQLKRALTNGSADTKKCGNDSDSDARSTTGSSSSSSSSASSSSSSSTSSDSSTPAVPKDAQLLRALEETERKGGDNSRDPRRNRLLRALAPPATEKAQVDKKRIVKLQTVKTSPKATPRSPLGKRRPRSLNGHVPRKDPLQQKADAREHLNEEQKKYLTRVKEKAGKSGKPTETKTTDDEIVEVSTNDNGVVGRNQTVAPLLTGISRRRKRSQSVPTTAEDPEAEADSKTDGELKKMKTLESSVIVPDIEAVEQQTSVKPEFCEEMEWEPIEQEKIAEEVHIVRAQLMQSEDTDVPMKLCSETELTKSEARKILYIVVDTNVFLSDLDIIIKARNAEFERIGQATILVPWTVIKELDAIKDDKTKLEALRAKARRAIGFLYKELPVKTSRIVGQRADDATNNRKLFETSCPDDEILQCCMQVRNLGNVSILLTYDKNLCNKASIHSIFTVGHGEDIFKINQYFVESETNGYLGSMIPMQEDAPEQVANAEPFNSEVKVQDVSAEIGKIVLAVLSEILELEMKCLFGEYWKQHTVIPPPWTVVSIIRCCVKHWIAAVSESFKSRKMIDILKILLEDFLDKGVKTFKDAIRTLERCKVIILDVKTDKYSPDMVPQAIESIDELSKLCEQRLEQIQAADEEKRRLQQMFGNVSEQQLEERCNKAFRLIDDVYNFAKNVCGLASQMKDCGITCPFDFENLEPTPSPQEMVTLATAVCKNIQIFFKDLRVAMRNIEELREHDTALKAILTVLTNFFPATYSRYNSSKVGVTQLDMLTCLKLRQDAIRHGLKQLDELVTHFYRISYC